MRRHFSLIIIYILKGQLLSAQIIDSAEQINWTFHFQMTVVSQSHSGFAAPYSGTNSLNNNVETGATSVTSTLFIGRKLWAGAAVYVNPELSGGSGLSEALGVAGALNGETYRIGDPSPSLSIARAYLQQNIPLGHTEYENVTEDINQVSDKVPVNRITINAGKFSISDFFDKNSFNHDPRTQFLNWSLMSNGAWDYPANTKGYTWGIVIEIIKPSWSFAISTVAVPKIANHPELEYVFGKAHSENAEFDKKTNFNGRHGVISFLASYTASRAPSYQQGLTALTDGDTTLLNVISGNAEGTTYGGKKTGFYLNLEQELTSSLGIFTRIGWNDGKHASWAFTEIDQTVQLGISKKGIPWKRNGDVAGLAVVVNGLSSDHRAFLKAGGYGFIIGDGKLNYAHENILETYYSAQLTTFFWLTADYQLVFNPAYNKDRKGPVNVFAIRAHIAF
jgi:high affinity Mn2+ porin